TKPSADGGAMNCCDHRLSRPEQTNGLLVKMTLRSLACPRRASRKIRAGAKRLAFGRKHDRAARRIAVERLIGFTDLRNQSYIEEIVRRPMDFDERDVLRDLDS